MTGAWVRGLTGWRRAGFGFAAGAASALGFAPLNFFPALLLGFAALLLLLDGADLSAHRLRAGFIAGWAFAFGQFLVGWHWIGYAFLVDPGAHLWQMPFALVFLTAGLALYVGIACALALYLWRPGFGRVLLLAVFYAAAEWLRGHALTGFPWNLPAYGWGASLAIMQSAALFGAYGLSFLTILLGASLAECFNRRFVLPAIMLALFAGLWGYGAMRLSAHPTDTVPGMLVRLVQPDIPQREKYQRPLVTRNWQRLLDLSRAPGPQPTHIIWPEAAPSFVLMRSPVALDQIGLLTNGGKVLITGAERVADADGQLSFFNSLYVFGSGGALDATYDKSHLVPFGEYVPFASILGKFGVTKLTKGPSGFDSGDGPHSYAVPGAPAMTPLICYEIIFPAAVTDHQNAAQRPQWFVNVTDDSWFGPWAGPHQHLLIARMRAIEEAIPVARAANTGISAMIDPLGRVIAQLGLNQMGVVDAPLPRALASTPYASLGDMVFALMLITSASLSFLRKPQRS